jgi:hypothetical protein
VLLLKESRFTWREELDVELLNSYAMPPPVLVATLLANVLFDTMVMSPDQMPPPSVPAWLAVNVVEFFTVNFMVGMLGLA